MKLLTRIRLVNWHLFENTTVNCQGTTYFIGINGAGKSTVLDAVQFALVGGQRDVRFNQAALSGGKRTLASYVRGELGTEAQRYLRGDATGVVALEFKNPDGTFFAHGAVIDAYEDGRNPDVAYFIVNNSTLNDNWFFKAPGLLFDTRAFKRHLENFALPPTASARVFTRLEDYRVHLLNRLGQLKDTFPAKIVKGLAFSPLTDIRSFVHNYLLDENLLDVKTLQAQLETLRHFESLAADVRERIESLSHIEDLDKERLANRRRRITNTYVARRAQADVFLDDLKSRRLELDSAKLEFHRDEIQRDDLTRNLRFAQSALTDAEIALHTDQTAQREKELREKITALTAELTLLTQRQTDFDRSLAAELTDAKKLKRLLTADKLEIPPAISTFLTEHETRQTEHALRNTQEALTTLGETYSREQTLINEQATQLKAEAERLDDEICKLRTGDRETSVKVEVPHSARLREILRAELGLGANEITYLCEVLQIPDPEWQNAIEGILGFNRFVLLVPPAHYDAAMQLYRKFKDTIHGATLLDTESILSKTTEHATRISDSLASEIQTDHPAARAFINIILGNYVKCSTIEQLRNHRTAITRECFIRRNFTDSHLNPQVYRRWFIGERAAPRQIEQRETRIKEIASELTQLNKRETALRERFEFINQPAPALRQVFDMVMDSQQVMGDSLFDSDFRQKHQQGWDLLFERLTSAHDDENAELRELQDYRNYLQFDIRIHYPNGDRALLSQINAKKSGGETTTPFYVAMAASFAQAYRLNQSRPSDTIRLALFDEAFGKMDTARTASALHFMREAGLQVLLATPPDKSGSLLPYVDSVCTVVRKNNHSFVIDIDKSEMIEKLESQ